jgi:hypothetical protein
MLSVSRPIEVVVLNCWVTLTKVPVRVIARRPDTIVGFGESRIHAETATFELRVSEVANPRPDDQLIVDGQTFVIQGEPERRDPDRLVWMLDTRPV